MSLWSKGVAPTQPPAVRYISKQLKLHNRSLKQKQDKQYISKDDDDVDGLSMMMTMMRYAII